MPRYQVTVEGREFDIAVEYRSEHYDVSVNDQHQCVTMHRLGGSRMLLLLEQQAFEVDVQSNGNDGARAVFLRGIEIPVRVENYNLARMRKTAGLRLDKAVDRKLCAPMPGLIVDVPVKPGQQVSAGDPLVIIEAMKMENIVKARTDATIGKIHVASGRSIEKNDLLIEFE